jgi:hypothetical protein
MKRRLLHTVGRALIGVLLFAQMAIAAYACPGLLAGASTEMQMLSGNAAALDVSDTAMSMAAGEAASPCADMAGATDPSPNLCAEHCRYGQQSDHAPTLTVPVVLLTTLYITPYSADVAMRPRPAATVSSALASVDPPHAILHCCFRT